MLDPSLIVPASDAEALTARIEAAHAGQIPEAYACRRYAETFSWDAVAELHNASYVALWQRSKGPAEGQRSRRR